MSAVIRPFRAKKVSLEGRVALCPNGGQNSSGAAAPNAMRACTVVTLGS
jgi:hypothetical protein